MAAQRTRRQSAAAHSFDVDLPEETLFEADDSAAMRRVLLASLESFADLGFHGATTRDIARRAGVSPAGLYVRYNSKSELLEHISEVTHEAMLQRMRTAADEEGSATDRLRGVVIAHVRFHAKYNTACRVANYELNSLEDDARERVRKLRQSMERVVSTLLAEGAENGEFAIDDRRVLTTFILSLGIDVARWFRAGHRLSPDELAEQYAGLLLRTVVKPKAARRATTRSSTG